MQSMNPVVWFEIYVDDLNRAKKFYETVFATQLSEMPMPDTVEQEMKMLAFPSTMEGAGAAGVLVKMEGFKAGGNSTLVYFGSQDCAVQEQRIAAAGGNLVQPKTSLGQYGFMVLATDTEGNMFGVHSMG